MSFEKIISAVLETIRTGGAPEPAKSHPGLKALAQGVEDGEILPSDAASSILAEIQKADETVRAPLAENIIELVKGAYNETYAEDVCRFMIEILEALPVEKRSPLAENVAAFTERAHRENKLNSSVASRLMAEIIKAPPSPDAPPPPSGP